jgi:integrase
VSSCRSPFLEAIVVVALNTGLRRGEILGLAWERVDFARGVLQLERTKSGRRREVPMNRAVYDVLSVAHREQEKHVDGERRGPVFRKASGVQERSSTRR